ncbi:hypothetical protein Tco_0032625 [Tanacetum coccineum]
MALPPRDQRHQYLRFKGLQYTDADIADFETRLGKIYKIEGHNVFISRAWRRLFEIRGPLVHELNLEFYRTFRFREAVVDLDTTGALHIAGRSQAPKKVTITDLFYSRGIDVSSVNVPYLLARYLRLFTSGRKHGAMISIGKFVAHLAEHFRLLTEERLQELTVIVRYLLVIDMAELVRLQICEELDDMWTWVALGPERHLDAATGSPEAARVAPAVDEGALVVLVPAQAPQPPLAARLAQTIDLSRFTVWAAGGISQLLDSAGATYVRYSVTRVPYQRCRVRQRTGDASTSTGQQDEQQPDP